jgi:dTDP-4-amino-4,6-dideoxygalactose transaminase
VTQTVPWRVRLAHPFFPDFDAEAFKRLLNSGWLTNAAEVQAFESAFAAYLGGGHAVGVSSCSAAIHLALLAHGLGPGSEVITSPMTFAATVNAIVHVGATPILVDVEPDTLNLDPAALAKAITPQTRAVIIVHFAGHPVDLAPILALKEQYGFALIHDAAHATEAQIAGKSIALYGDTSCFSFYATKNLSLGEGGMLVATNPAIAETVRQLRMHGMSLGALERHGDNMERWRHWELERPGFNYKMTELVAHLGQQQLRRLDEWHARRAKLVELYNTGIAGVAGIRTLSHRPGHRHAHHIYVILLERPDLDRDLFICLLRQKGIECSIHYRAIYELRWYRNQFDWSPDDFPVSTDASRNCITLPLHPQMNEAQVNLVVEVLVDLLKK